MSLGFILLILAGLLVLFGAGQRVLDRLRLTDRQALLFIALIIGGGFLPEIRVTPLFSFNVGGALIPLMLCFFLWAKADTAAERARSVAATMVTAVAVYLIGRNFPEEPEAMPFDINYLYGLAAGAIACAFGRSRRGAFIAGTLGVMLANVITAAEVWSMGVNQTLVLGGAGGFDVIVIAGLLAVLVSELTGELAERFRRGRQKPVREFRNGSFVGREQR